MPQLVIRSIIVGICVLVFSPPLSAMMWCYDTQVLLPYQVCTDWWDGTRTCHTQLGWFDATYCEVYGRWEGPIFPPGGGPDDPIDYPPPSCEIVGVSDENPDQPILSIQANDAVVSMSLAYNGWTNQTVGRTDTIAMQPVNYFADGQTTVTVQCRNTVNVYSTPTMTVGRWAGVYSASDVIYGTWAVLDLLGGEPKIGHGEWYRDVTLLTNETSYSVSTFGTRNGMYEHDGAEDLLRRVGDSPRPAWDSTFVSNDWGGSQTQAWGWPCKHEWIVNAICFDNISTFVTPYSPNGNAVITDFMVPIQNVFNVGLLSGREVSVGPH